MVAIIGSVVAFLVALLVGGLAIYVGASVIVNVEDYSHAVVTALVGAIALVLTSYIPVFGPVIALLAWVWVINRRYPGGWIDAGLIGFIAWLAAVVLLIVLNSIFRLGIGASGIPGL